MLAKRECATTRPWLDRKAAFSARFEQALNLPSQARRNSKCAASANDAYVGQKESHGVTEILLRKTAEIVIAKVPGKALRVLPHPFDQRD